jgi:hypothetical protein
MLVSAKRLCDITVLDPKKLGEHTKVSRLWKVEYGKTICFIFDEPRYGVYCLTHGKGDCTALREIIELDKEKK